MKKLIYAWYYYSPLYLFLLPFIFIINGWSEFAGFLTAKQLLLNYIVTVLGIGLIYLLSVLLLRKKTISALFTLLLSLSILTFGPFHDFLKSFIGAGFFSSYKFLLPIGFLIFFSVYRKLKLKATVSSKTIFFINTIFTVLLIFEVGVFTLKKLNKDEKDLLLDHRFEAFDEFTSKKNLPDSLKPDIFFLVFDAMPSSKSIKEHWGFDNSKVDSFLQQQKFFVASDSKSNYNITMLSVNSCMNMNYFLDEQIYKDGEIGMLRRGSRSIEENSLLKILKKENYTIQLSQSVSLQETDHGIESFFSKLLTYHFLYKTLPGRLYKDLGWHLMRYEVTNSWLNYFETKGYQKKQKDLLTTIKRVKEVCDTSNTPSFVYAHFLLPHSPFIFDSTGRLKSIPQIRAIKKKSTELAFYHQVQFADKIISELVLYIKENNQKNSVIVIIGDHGYRNAFGKGYMIFDNLTAIYYPDNNYTQLHPAISPVNIFRATLNKYLGTGLDLLKDSSIFVPYNVSR
jgi:hypothetical protein